MTSQLFPSAVQPRHTDERYTPAEVFEALGVHFDLDVCAPAGGVPWIPATEIYTADDDGLAQPWHGLVWCNPPFSNPAPWTTRWLDHADGVILFPLNVNSTWMFELVRSVPAVLMIEHCRFHHPTHTGRHVPVTVALAGVGRGVVAVERAARVLRGVLLAVVGATR